MPRTDITTAIARAVDDRLLLDHPFYRAWQSGDLQQQDLATYAAQYRHFERCLPAVLSEVASRLAPGPARELVEANLRDELSNPRPHLELFEQFSASVGAASEEPARAATNRLVSLYRDAATTDPVAALSVIAAYEGQAADIAATKASSLAACYGVAPAGTEFWSVHAEVEEQHSHWTVDAIGELQGGASVVEGWAARSAQAWWEFLDERQAARAA